MGKTCVPPRVDPQGGCVPGCYSGGQPNWCPDESRWWHCNGYPPERLDQMLRVQERHNSDGYNEVVFDVQGLTHTWPEGIEAIVYSASAGATARSQADELQRQFVEAFDPPAQTALLQMNLDDHQNPFQLPPVAM
mmetsp:Transcript_29656/g.59629  ORF Transcript_29656/g.59629 Transcript_29656/m.59629 type:complete len:135 (-) Transcript_29656:113-517(-)